MKKAGPMILIAVSIVFAAFLCGFFIGRNSAGTPLTLTQIPETTQTVPETVPSTAVTAPPPAENDGKVNINTADVEQLQTLPGIGKVLAQRIVDDRAENGPFSGITDLARVEGIGAERLAAILDLITVGG